MLRNRDKARVLSISPLHARLILRVAVTELTGPQSGLEKENGSDDYRIVRGEEPSTNPSPDSRIESGDSLVLVGSHAHIEKAIQLLEPPSEAESTA